MSIRHFALSIFTLFSVFWMAPLSWAEEDQRSVTVKDSHGLPIVTYRNSKALVVYVDDYKFWPPLRNTKSEADKVKSALEAQGFEVKVVPNPRSSKELAPVLLDFMSTYGSRNDVDRMIVFFTGHGLSRRKIGFLIGADAPSVNFNGTGDDPRFYEHSVPMEVFNGFAINSSLNKHVLIVLDSCSSGAVFSAKPGSSGNLAQDLPAAISNSSRQFLTAGSADEEVPGVSVFTPLFIDAISGSADINNDGLVTVSEVASYVTNMMPRKQLPNLKQSPQYARVSPFFKQAEPPGEMVFSKASISSDKGLTSQIVGPKEPSPLNANQSTENLHRRSRYEIEYFDSRANTKDLVETITRRLGFGRSKYIPSEFKSQSSAPAVNAMWVGPGVDINDVKLFANSLILDGIQLISIRSFRPTSPNSKRPLLIQLGADRALSQKSKSCRPLTVDQIQKAQVIDRESLVCR